MSQHDVIDRQPSSPKLFVTGGTGYLGRRVVRALLERGAGVTVLVRPGSAWQAKLGQLIDRVDLVTGDAWKLGSLAGQSRGHSCVVHLVGGRGSDPARGLTNQRLNYTSTRTVASMAMADGVQRFVYVSTAGLPPWASEFSDSKHMAEEHLRRCGLDWLIVRAPRLVGGERRHTLLSFLMKPLRHMPLLDRLAPLPVGIAARGVARLALDPQAYRQIHYGPDLRRLGWPPPKPPLPSQPADRSTRITPP